MSPGSDLAAIPPEKLAASNLLPAHLRDNPVNTAVMVSTLQALDLPVTFLNLSETYVINGRPGLMAALQRTIAWRHGWQITPVSVGVDKAVVRIRQRGGRDPGTDVSFTMEDAKRANLAGKDTYKQWPDRMLFARACTKAISLFCPQVLYDTLADTANAEEWREITGTAGSSEPATPLRGDDEPAVPDHVYDDEPAAYEDPGAAKYDLDDVTRPFE